MVGARSTERQRPRRWLRRAVVIAGGLLVCAAAAAIAFLALNDDPLTIGSSGPDPGQPVQLFTSAWAAGDYRTMYNQLTPAARAATSYRRFVAAYRTADATGSLKSLLLEPGRRFTATTAEVPVLLHTALFGALREPLTLPLAKTAAGYRIDWSPQLAWPGLQPGEHLSRSSRVPGHRGAILASDRSVLAEGPAGDRQYPQGAPFYTPVSYTI
jgi:peptidoglycan glycosyltransferase